MKSIKKYSKQLSLLLVLIMLFQGCVSYGPPVTMNEAVRKTEKTKVKFANDEIYRYDYVILEDSVYYGVKSHKGELIKSKIDMDNIYNVRLYSETRTIVATILAPIALVGVVGAIVVSTWSGPNLSWGN